MRTTTTAEHLTPSQRHQISSTEYATCKNKPKSVPTAPATISTSYCHFYRLIYPRFPPSPFPQRQHFMRSGAVAASPYACHPSCRPLRAVALLTSFHNGSISRDPVPLRIADGITILPIVPVKRRSRATLATTVVICGIQCRCGIWRKEKGLPDAAVARTLRRCIFLHCSRLLRNLDYVHIYWGASAVQIEQVHLHCSRLLRIFTA